MDKFEKELARPIHSDLVDEDGMVDDAVVETYYRPCKGIAYGGPPHERYLRVLVDEEGYDLETRVLLSTLISAGWKPPDDKPTPMERGGT